jgi:PBP1b-binding outer membrane lipoprotein LpoB
VFQAQTISIEKGHRMKRSVLLLLLSFVLPGCGYHFQADGEPVGIQLESLAIPMFSSTSSEIGFEANFTKVIRQEFISQGRVPLVPEEKAQAVLVGKIQDIRADPVNYRSQQVMVGGNTYTYQTTSSRKLRVRVDVQLVDRRSGKVIWHEAAMEDQASYTVTGDPLELRYTEQQALETIAERLAKRIYLRTMERF